MNKKIVNKKKLNKKTLIEKTVNKRTMTNKTVPKQNNSCVRERGVTRNSNDQENIEQQNNE